MTNINIVILGAGYAGIRAALGLEKKFRAEKEIQITIIDRNDYHLFNPNLYEVATADEDLASLIQLKRSVVIPLGEIFKGKKLRFIKGEIKEIDRQSKTVALVSKKISYDYLLAALGPAPDYLNIQGAEQYALPLKGLVGALRIKNQIEFAMQARRLSGHKDNLKVVVAGGGLTGVEFAAELAGEMKYLAWRNEYSRNKIEILILEAQANLLGERFKKMGRDAFKRLKKLGVKVMLGSKISEVARNYIKLLGEEGIRFDVLVWAAGVTARNVPFAQPLSKDSKGRILTNEHLAAKTDDKIFALGDCASIFNKSQKLAPATAEDAIWHGDYISYALPLIMQNLRPKPYVGRQHGAIAQVGGKYAIVNYGGFYVKGIFGYIIRQIVNWYYYAGLIGIKKAAKYLFFQMKIYSRND